MIRVSKKSSRERNNYWNKIAFLTLKPTVIYKINILYYNIIF